LEYQFWQHKTNDDIYAVELNSDYEPVGAYGPLNIQELKTENLPLFKYDIYDVDYLISNMDNFRFYEI